MGQWGHAPHHGWTTIIVISTERRMSERRNLCSATPTRDSSTRSFLPPSQRTKLSLQAQLSCYLLFRVVTIFGAHPLFFPCVAAASRRGDARDDMLAGLPRPARHYVISTERRMSERRNLCGAMPTRDPSIRSFHSLTPKEQN